LAPLVQREPDKPHLVGQNEIQMKKYISSQKAKVLDKTKFCTPGDQQGCRKLAPLAPLVPDKPNLV
jgi:hypothetical protein